MSEDALIQTACFLVSEHVEAESSLLSVRLNQEGNLDKTKFDFGRLAWSLVAAAVS